MNGDTHFISTGMANNVFVLTIRAQYKRGDSKDRASSRRDYKSTSKHGVADFEMEVRSESR